MEKTLTKKIKTKMWLKPHIFTDKIKKSKLVQKIDSDIEYNSRIYFAMSKKLSQEKLIDYQIEAAKEANSALTKKSKKKKIFNTCLFLINILLVVLVFYNFATEQGGIEPLSTLFAKHPRWGYLLIAVGLYFLTTIFNGFKFMFLIHNRAKKWRPFLSYKIGAVGRYYDNITPLGTGGQPFEIYSLKKDGYSGDIATAIPLAKHMIWQITMVVFCTFVLIAYTIKSLSSPLVLALAWLGLSLNLLVFLFIFFMSITRKWGASLVVGVLKILHKLKIIKNYRKTLEKVLRFVKSYQLSIKQVAKSPMTLIASILSTLGAMLCNSSIAYFVLKAFTDTPTMNLWDIICICHICEIASSIIPLPGGSGATELSFNALLGSLFPMGTLFWGILIWRFLTYYMYIVEGWIIFGYDFIKNKTNRNKAIKIDILNAATQTNLDKNE